MIGFASASMDSSSPLSSPPPSSLFNDFDEIAVLPPPLPYSAASSRARARARTHSSPSALPTPPPSYQSATSQQIPAPAEPDSTDIAKFPEAPSTPIKADQPQDHQGSSPPILPRRSRSGSLRKSPGEKGKPPFSPLISTLRLTRQHSTQHTSHHHHPVRQTCDAETTGPVHGRATACQGVSVRVSGGQAPQAGSRQMEDGLGPLQRQIAAGKL